MVEFDWLYNYRYTWGIEKSLQGVVRRSAYLTESATAFKIFNTHYAAMQNCYHAFFADVKQFSLNNIEELQNMR